MSNANNQNSKGWLILSIVLLIIAVGGGVFLIRSGIRRKRANENFENLNTTEASSEIAEGSTEATPDTLEGRISAELGIEVPVKNLDFAKLREENPDIYAWICVPDTDVDYPILHHPTDHNYDLDTTRHGP